MSDKILVEFIKELNRAIKNLDAPVELLAICGSFRDTLDDAELLGLLKDYNRTGEYLYSVLKQ